LFDEELSRNQDDEFNYRLTKAGMKIWLTNNTGITYHVRSSFAKLFRQYYQYGYWKVYVNKKHKTITTFRQLMPLLFVLFLAGGATMSLLFPALAKAYFTLLLFYLLLAMVFALTVTKNFGQTPAVLIAFIIIHFAYGWGYLLGIIDFILLRKSNPNACKSSLNR